MSWPSVLIFELPKRDILVYTTVLVRMVQCDTYSPTLCETQIQIYRFPQKEKGAAYKELVHVIIYIYMIEIYTVYLTHVSIWQSINEIQRNLSPDCALITRRERHL